LQTRQSLFGAVVINIGNFIVSAGEIKRSVFGGNTAPTIVAFDKSGESKIIARRFVLVIPAPLFDNYLHLVKKIF